MPRKAPLPAWCTNCRQAPTYAQGLCHSCYSYRRRNTRLPERHQIRQRELHSCSNCGDLTGGKSGLCSACHQYRQRNGVTRPRHHWHPYMPCANCGRPLDATPSTGEKCLPCYQYELKFGQPRPKRLWGVNGLGWCDCGLPAVVHKEVKAFTFRIVESGSIIIRPTGRTITLKLCKECLAWEEANAP